MERERILRTLQADLTVSQGRCAAAAAHFRNIIGDVPSGLSMPDGMERIRQASRDYRIMQAAAMSALGRLNDFIVHGTTPFGLR
jgi:hypothetical protein